MRDITMIIRQESTRFRVACGALLIALLAGCDNFLEVENPGSLTTDDLENPQILPALRLLPEAAGAENHDDWVRAMGLIGDDFTEWQTRQVDLDQDWGLLELFNGTLENLYNNLAADVWIVREARRKLEVLEPNPAQSQAIAKSYYWDGELMVNMSDAFTQVTFEGGPPHSPAEGHTLAIGVLQQGLQMALDVGLDADYVAAFYATMARAERALFFEPGGSQENLTRAAQYAQQALDVKSNFRLDAKFVPPGKTNDVQVEFGPGRGASPLGVQETFGEGWTDPVTGGPDPRIESGVSEKLGTGPAGDLYYLTKYADNGSPIPVSRWQEAELIVAEERLEAGDLPTAVTRINRVRSAAGLPDFDSNDPAAVRAQLIYERRSEFFAEGRSWPDLRRYGIFPEKWNAEARQLGIDRRIPISQRERSTNPNFP